MSKRVSVYLSDRTCETLAGGGMSTRINRMADRYAEMLRRMRIDQRFTAAELDALRAVARDWAAEPAAALAGGLALELEDAIPDGIGAEFGVDVQELLGKLRGLAFAEEVALAESLEAYWRGVSLAAGAGEGD
jgi:hypothetical protein